MYPPILLSPSLRAIDHAPTPNPRRFRPLWCAPTHTGASAARSHENDDDDDDDDEVPSNAERRAKFNRDTRVTSNNARAHVAARSRDRDRDHDTDHDRDRCGPPRRRASCTSCDAAPSLAMAVEVPAVTRRVKRAACHAHCASRARMRTSSPRIARTVTVSVPPAHDRHVRATAALARSIDRARGVALAMAVKEAVGYTARHVRHEKRASLACTSTPSTRITRVITDFRSPRARASCGGGGARSSLDRAHEVWRRRWRVR